ncbi:hypothetical protein K7432_016010 [Basidiobolus ranarum]|uniref:Uncharacterized protein n=1 Tax=Basidiobolus ranarum TaxID=34480 RepID=A0ABR2VN57_9FUNG
MKSCGEGLGCVRPGHKREFFTQDKTMPGICRRLGEEGTRCNPHAQGKAKCMNALSCFPRPASGRNVGVCVNPYNRLIKITLSDSNQNHGINATLPSSTKTVSKSTESTATKSTSILATSTSILGSSSGVAGTPTIHSTYPKDPGLNQTCGGKDRIKCGLDLLCVYPSHDRISTSFGVCRKKGEVT